MTESDIIIIGSGPAGLELSRIAVARNLKSVVIEADNAGGTCLNRGCIPTKALCRSAEVATLISSAASYGLSASVDGSLLAQYGAAAARKDAVVAGMREMAEASLSRSVFVKGEARFTGTHTVEVAGELFTAPKIVIATGSAPALLPVEGASLAMTSDGFLALDRLPSGLCIIGGGVIGMEIACIAAAFGVAVTVVEYCPEILPNFDREVARRLRSLLSRRGIRIIINASVTRLEETEGGGRRVVYTAKGKEASVEAGAVLMATGRRPVVPQGSQEIGIKTDRRGIKTDSSFMTSVEGVYAVGDVNGRMMLAHAASAQAIAVMGGEVNLDVIPAVAYSLPECSMVGLTEEQCKEKGVAYAVGKSLYRSNGKAAAMGETDGFVKIIVSAADRSILGCHIIGAHSGELIAEVALAMANGLHASDIASTVHAHPTLSELVASAVLSLPKQD